MYSGSLSRAAVGRDLPYTVVSAVGDIESPVRGNVEPVWLEKLGPDRRPAITGKVRLTGTDDRRNRSVRSDTANTVIIPLQHVQATIRSQLHILGSVEPCRGGAASVPRVAPDSRPGDCGDPPVRPDPPDTVVEGVRNVEIACRVAVQAFGSVEAGPGGWEAFTREALAAVAGQRFDPSVTDHPNPVMALLRNEHRPVWPHRHPGGVI